MSDEISTDDSRRSFMKKGALAAGALAIGAGASASGVAAQEDGNALVFSYDYHPGQSFDVVAQLEQSTTVNVLQVDDETVSEISQPDDYTGHVIRYNLDGSAGITAFLFSQDVSLSSGDSGTLGEDASMFSPELNLLSTDLGGGGGGNGGNGNG
ncbi:twin-arginine translocation signal domain-containing protein, partial [Saliphagus sp. LR7]|uniref:twin-arginine translocation signal domain-containing protein n=1 Tax=Saliphagus sp. LR7 TaxID=2282654 RepID=UPI0018E4F46E